MWLETKENNEQLREEVEVAKEELSNTKKKLEEALVVCVHRSLPFLSLYQQSFKPFHQVPCYSAALLSPRPVLFDILTLNKNLNVLISSLPDQHIFLQL